MDTKRYRSFVLLAGLIPLGLGLLSLFRGRELRGASLLLAAFLAGFFWFFDHQPLFFLYALWKRLAEAGEKIIMPSIIFTIYYLLLFPLSMISRLCGKKWLSASPQWRDVSPDSDPRRYERIF